MDEGFAKNESSDMGQIMVLWNLDDYPIPAGDSAYLFLITHNIISAIRLMGMRGPIQITVFGDKPKFDESDVLSNAGMGHIPTTYGESTVNEMAMYTLSTAIGINSGVRFKYVVIAKKNTDPAFHRVLKCLKSREFTVVLVEPPDETAQDSLFPSVDSVLSCSRLLDEAEPISSNPQSLIDPSELSGYPRSRLRLRINY